MEVVATRPLARSRRAFPDVDLGVVSIWVLVGGPVLYLAINGGGYGVVAHSQVGILVWWLVLVGAAWGLLPVTRPSRAGWGAIALFGGFVLWSGLASTWSISSERSLADLSLVAGYFGVLVLAVSVHRSRDQAVRHTLAALATAIVIVAGLALASRVRPGLFPGAEQTSSFLPGTQRRLGWPLNYWNGLAALLALGLPLLLAVATSARMLLVQAATAAAIPIVALCGYLTFSRGGALAGAIAVVVFIALAPERVPKLATMLIGGAGSAALIAAASTRAALEHGFVSAAARHQGDTLVIPILLVCAGVALAQVGVGLAQRHGTPPRLLVIPPRRARLLVGLCLIVAVAVALAAGGPATLSHTWRDFKHPTSPALGSSSLSRFGTVSGNGRYDYWKVAVNATHGHIVEGNGPGTYQLLWLPRAPYFSYVQNAHSLYFETLAEEGAVGLALLAGFLALILGCGIALTTRVGYEKRVRAAGVAAALAAFVVSAGFDWVWQMPVLPVAFIFLGAAVVAPSSRRRCSTSRKDVRVLRAAEIVAAVGCLIAIGVPLATANAVQSSQTAASRGDPSLALRDAQQAARVEPGAASPQVQLATVEELQGDVPAAVLAAERAARNEPANWSTWLVLSRLEAEAGKVRASLADFERARSLNPYSPVFADARA